MNKMRPIPDYGDHMSLEEFIGDCKTGCFMDYDGVGYYATYSEVSDIEVRPSDIMAGNVDARWTHIMWFNK